MSIISDDSLFTTRTQYYVGLENKRNEAAQLKSFYRLYRIYLLAAAEHWLSVAVSCTHSRVTLSDRVTESWRNAAVESLLADAVESL